MDIILQFPTKLRAQRCETLFSPQSRFFLEIVIHHFWTIMHSFQFHSCLFKQPRNKQGIRQYLFELVQQILQAEVQANHHVFRLSTALHSQSKMPKTEIKLRTEGPHAHHTPDYMQERLWMNTRHRKHIAVSQRVCTASL